MHTNKIYIFIMYYYLPTRFCRFCDRQHGVIQEYNQQGVIQEYNQQGVIQEYNQQGVIQEYNQQGGHTRIQSIYIFL